MEIVTKVTARWQGDLGNQLRLFHRAHRDAIRFGHRNSAVVNKSIHSIKVKLNSIFEKPLLFFTWPCLAADVAASAAVCSATGRRRRSESLSNCRRGCQWPSHLPAGYSAPSIIPDTSKCYQSTTSNSQNLISFIHSFKKFEKQKKNHSKIIQIQLFKTTTTPCS